MQYKEQDKKYLYFELPLNKLGLNLLMEVL